MSKAVVSAVQLSDIFANRLRQMYPLTTITGIMIEPIGEGKWKLLLYIGDFAQSESTDAAIILKRLQAELLVDL